MVAVYPPVETITQLSPYHLTLEQVQFFDDYGYLVLRNWIPKPLLEKLQATGNRWISQGWDVPESDPRQSDFKFRVIDGHRTMFRVDYVHNKGESASLELLGSPYVLGVAESLCGRNFVPTYESMVFKDEGDGVAIRWHQDAVHPRGYRIFNYDLYLDSSLADGGALKVIPGSNIHAHDVCKIEETYGWDHPDAIYVEMQPGDVLLHDVMVVHGSEETHGKALRRTIYYEFRAAEEILEDGPWDRSWIDQRLRLLPVGLRRYAVAFPDAPQFEWRIDDEFRPDVSEDDEVELRIAHVVHMNGSYCSAGSAGKPK
jgi:ectoine hydroxylase-related dioxygenase (phytanoyl-CoA dioxygenase family)